MKRLFSATRYLVLLPILGSLLASFVLIVYVAADVVREIVSLVARPEIFAKGAKFLALRFIQHVDLFLLATIFLVISFGLYELFISPELELPPWLIINNLDDLKNKLIGVVVVVLGVLFLGQAITWDGTRDLLHYGAGTALVIFALSYFLSLKSSKDGNGKEEKEK